MPNAREDRKRQLLKMWKDRKGQLQVLRLFHQSLPNGHQPQAGMSVFDVILDSEFSGPESPANVDADT